MWSNFWIGYLIATLYVPFENFWVKFLYQWKTETQIYQKLVIFSAILKSILKSPIKTENKTAYFSLFAGLCLGEISKLAIICHNLNEHCPPCALISAQTAPIAHPCLVVAEWWVCAQLGKCKLTASLQWGNPPQATEHPSVCPWV